MSVKKILALLLAAMMVLGMTSAMADTTATPVTDGDATEANQTDTATFKLTKTLVVDASSIKDVSAGHAIAYPGITYNFTLAPADITTKPFIKDSAGNQVAVKAGKMEATDKSTGTLSIAIDSDSVTMNANGQEMVTGLQTILFTAQDFGAPGVYRYELKEATTNDAARIAAGIVKYDKADDSYFIDVYVGYKKEGTTIDYDKLVINGYTLINSNNSIDANETAGDGDTVLNETEGKESGLEELPIDPGTNTDDPTDDKIDLSGSNSTFVADASNSDMYYTYDVTVTKQITGVMGDTEHEFPFTVAVNNAGLNYDVYGKFSNAVQTAAEYKGLTATVDTYYLRDDDSAQFFGLSPKATIGILETNDTSSTYKVNATVNSVANTVKVGTNTTTDAQDFAASQTAQIIFASGVQDTTDTTGATAKVSAYQSTTVATTKYTANDLNTEYTNNLEQISPTGVVLRFAPYFAMFAAGCALFLILATKRSKKEEE